MRGVLTKEADNIAERMIKRKITTAELRLIAYVQYVMVNEQKINPTRVNQDEREILSKWREEGFIEGGASGLSITKEFWDFMCEMLFETYVKNSFSVVCEEGA